MMDKDSKLIFESYNRINEQVYENEDLFSPETYKNTIISWNVAQFLDPTGVLSYPDAIAAISKFIEKPSWVAFLLVILAIFQALPNFGIGAGPAAAIAWGVAKKQLKDLAVEASTNPKALIEATNIALNYLMRHQERVIEAIEKINVLPKAVKDELKYIIMVGKVDNVQHLDNVIKAMDKVPSTTLSKKVKETVGKGRKAVDVIKYGTRAAGDTIPDIIEAEREYRFKKALGI